VLEEEVLVEELGEEVGMQEHPCADTPFPHDYLRPFATPEPLGPPPYSTPNTPPTYQPHSPTPEALEPGEVRQSSGPEQLYVHPGPGWTTNLTEDGVRHDITIPVGAEGVERAPFIQYDFDTDSPELLTTHSTGCPVYSQFLHT
jgi:hypothetical protein